MNAATVEQEETSEIDKGSFPQKSLSQSENDFDDGQQISKIDHAEPSVELDISGLLNNKKTPDNISHSDINAPLEYKHIAKK